MDRHEIERFYDFTSRLKPAINYGWEPDAGIVRIDPDVVVAVSCSPVGGGNIHAVDIQVHPTLAASSIASIAGVRFPMIAKFSRFGFLGDEGIELPPCTVEQGRLQQVNQVLATACELIRV